MQVDRFVPAEPAKVWQVLADGWTYPLWVVGATHMRAVDDGFPAVGTRLHHSVGAWPLQIQDRTEVVACEPESLLELRGHAWPTGAARIRITLRPEPGGTRLAMDEHAESGPAVLLPGVVQQALLVPRNKETLARLDAVVRERP
ncbi:SRPBCC family protein [Pseudonocardia kujensis]|uniref:SRPBCC family protein n=1 Tax=Pseudonocardia kujensis TaxID=1128675 RepID=UPI001E3CCBCC|nr:SRPBCC family protein [Pseudonocardia kujensis]MCE0763856.1 SRPBCC family protein [Pseudonocardia kujensis]